MKPPQDRSVGAAFALTLLFGPFGILYVSVPAALVTMAVSAVAVVVTLGLAIFLVWPASMIVGCVIASRRRSEHAAWLAYAWRQQSWWDGSVWRRTDGAWWDGRGWRSLETAAPPPIDPPPVAPGQSPE
ncbi:MAG: hypothetical protein ACRDZ1_11620 [Acidimicrobiia bacterium]